jgi:hypothetical protein
MSPDEQTRTPRRLASHDSRGSSTAEYLGVVVVVAAIIGAVATTGVGTTISAGLASAVCRIAQGSGCAASSGDSGDSGGSDPSNGSNGSCRDTARDARGSRRRRRGQDPSGAVPRNA